MGGKYQTLLALLARFFVNLPFSRVLFILEEKEEIKSSPLFHYSDQMLSESKCSNNRRLVNQEQHVSELARL